MPHRSIGCSKVDADGDKGKASETVFPDFFSVASFRVFACFKTGNFREGESPALFSALIPERKAFAILGTMCLWLNCGIPLLKGFPDR